MVIMSFGCRFAQLHFWFLFLFVCFVFSLICVLLHFYDFFFVVDVRVDAFKMIAASWNEYWIISVTPDESLAWWPVWASYSQAKIEVYLQYIHTHADTTLISSNYYNFWVAFSCFPSEPYICWYSVLTSAECNKLPALALHRWWAFLRVLTPLQELLWDLFGVCSAFIGCLKML